jgi:hypothetical protein
MVLFNFGLVIDGRLKVGINETQQFKVRWYNSVDSRYEEIDNLYHLHSCKTYRNTTDSVKGVPSNKDKDKVISNVQGYDWDTHVDLTLPSGSPHGIAPAEKFTNWYVTKQSYK